MKNVQCPSCKNRFDYPVGQPPSACPSCGFSPRNVGRPRESHAGVAPSAQPPKKSRKKLGPVAKTFMVIGAVLFLFGVLAAVLPDEDEVPTPDGSGDEGNAEVQSGASDDDSSGDDVISSEDESEPEVDPEPDPEGIEDGVWKVGDEVAPGVYHSAGSSGCYWARLSGFSGELDDLEANDFGSEKMIVEILPSDEGFESKSCALWVPLEHHLNVTEDDRPYDDFGAGAFVVGDEIDPGLWRASGGSTCYWERLSGFTGDLDHIEANDNPSGQVIVEVKEMDQGFSSSGCGTWISLDLHLEETADERPYSEIEAGTFVVGDEMGPGEWRTDGGSNCYWARLSGFSGGIDDIESNGLPEGQTIVEVKPTDTGFVSSGCGTWEYLG